LFSKRNLVGNRCKFLKITPYEDALFGSVRADFTSEEHLCLTAKVPDNQWYRVYCRFQRTIYTPICSHPVNRLL